MYEIKKHVAGKRHEIIFEIQDFDEAMNELIKTINREKETGAEIQEMYKKIFVSILIRNGETITRYTVEEQL